MLIFTLHLVEVKLAIVHLSIFIGTRIWNHISLNESLNVSYSKFKFLTKFYILNNEIPMISLDTIYVIFRYAIIYSQSLVHNIHVGVFVYLSCMNILLCIISFVLLYFSERYLVSNCHKFFSFLYYYVNVFIHVDTMLTIEQCLQRKYS